MLALSHIDDEDLMEEFCAMAGMLYAPGLEGYAAFDRGETVGYCLFFAKNGELEVVSCSWEETLGLGLCDGLLRAALDFAQRQRGCETAVFSAALPRDVLEKLPSLGYFTGGPFSITDFFTGCKHCGDTV
ncbi:MAG: hypothetical protein PHD67_04060 [Oscillospiraceae bacterium]|nr:hypothetical protein [Oscillospiraceae bacterium]